MPFEELVNLNSLSVLLWEQVLRNAASGVNQILDDGIAFSESEVSVSNGGHLSSSVNLQVFLSLVVSLKQVYLVFLKLNVAESQYCEY